MSDTFSHERFSVLHFGNNSKCQNVDMEVEYQNCSYKISIPLILEEDWPRFSSVTINTVYQGQPKSAIITHTDFSLQHPKSCHDRRSIGEFVFLLAAKFKRDLLFGVDEDKAGFLHTDEIKKLKRNGRTDIGKQIYRSIPQASSEFLLKFLFAEKQLYHLLGYLGKTSGDTDLVWWLNVSSENIEFKNGNSIIPDKILKESLGKLFPQTCLLSDSRKEEFRIDHILVDSNDTTNKAIEKVPTVIPPTDHRIKEFCEKLEEDALRHLKEKLHGKELDGYMPLDLELGLIKESDSKEEGSRYDHNREWKEFEYDELENPQDVYILSSETGSGKTTFLRHLQLATIKDTDLIPIFLEASSVATLDCRNNNTNNFLEGVAKLFNGYLKSKHEHIFLQTHLDKIVFLIDGLDQITGSGTEYNNLVDKLIGVIEDKLIITSRPFAVTDKEKDSKINFLRLKPFSEEETELYFGEKYERAKSLSRTCSEMIRIPMLAYMVRKLIEDGNDEHVKNRTGLYRKFIDEVFNEYKHENLEMSENERSEVREIYGEISFKAIANQEPYFQRIPISFARNNVESDIKIDALFKYGIAHSIINRTSTIERSIYFSHQSFQEYLAAEYIKDNDAMVKQVLIEKWNPKWKEVIKFLVGIKGQEIIEKILNEKDNPIHSKLFLAAELVSETDVIPKLKSDVSQKIESLLDCSLCGEDAEKYWMYVSETRAIKRLIGKLKEDSFKIRNPAVDILVQMKDKIDSEILSEIVCKLEDEDPEIRGSALDILGQLDDKIDSEIVEKIVCRLEDEDSRVCDSAGTALGKLKDKIDNEILGRIVCKLEDDNDWVRRSALFALGKLRDKIDSEILAKMVCKLEDEDTEIRSVALFALGKLKDKIDSEILGRIVCKLEDDNDWVRRSALFALANLKDNVSGEVIEKVVCMAMDADGLVCHTALDTLGQLSEKVDNTIVTMIVNKLDDDNVGVCSSALDILGQLDDKIDSEIIDKIVCRLEDEDTVIRLSALDALGQLNNKIDNEIIRKIACRLEDKEPEVRDTALTALMRLKGKVDGGIIEKVVCKLEDECTAVRCSALIALSRLSNSVDGKIAEKLVAKLLRLEDSDDYKLLKKLYKEGKLEFLG